MAMKIANSAYGTLSASITTSSTSIILNSGQGARFPTFAVGDFGYATLSDSSNNLEIVKITARSTDTFTVERGQDGTTARAYAAGDRMDMRPVAANFTDMLDTVTAAATYATQTSLTTGLAAKLDTATAVTTYAKLAGGNTLAGTQKIQASHWKVQSLGSISGPISIDMSTASTFAMTITGTTTFTLLNAPTGGYDMAQYFKITNGGAHTINWPAGTKKSGGFATSLGLSTAGTDLLVLWYDFEAGCWVVGLAYQDYKV